MPKSRGVLGVAGLVAMALAARALAARGEAYTPAYATILSSPTSPGQAAFGAIAEVVRILESDSTTDWSKVKLEALRQHLIDMDLVVMHADVAERAVPGGFDARVTGQGAVGGAITRMVTNQSRMLAMMGDYHVTADPLASGMHIVVTAGDPRDARAVTRLRGLGFVGVLTEGDHHTRHHLAIARGEPDPHR